MWSRATAEIDLDAIRANVRGIRKLVGNSGIWPAVKANAYGLGAVAISKACAEAGANGFCVAAFDEAVELRNAGFTQPILVLGRVTPQQAKEVPETQVHCMLADLELARELSKAGESAGKPVNVHIKVDTGLGRLGVRVDEVCEFSKTLASLPGIQIAGMFTHFSAADEIDRSYTLGQIAAFEEALALLRRESIQIPIVHAANSAAVLAYPQSYYDIVRPGIIVYGHYPSREVTKSIQIKSALTLKSRVTFVKNVSKGACIGYSRTHSAPKNSKIATVSIGYGDGYPRALSGRGFASVRGQKVPVVGIVCMDQLMLDVTDVTSVEPGDEVILYGGGIDYLHIDDIAEQLGTIAHELMTGIGRRVPRTYRNE